MANAYQQPGIDLMMASFELGLCDMAEQKWSAFQPIEITLDNHGSGSIAVTRVAGEKVDRRMV